MEHSLNINSIIFLTSGCLHQNRTSSSLTLATCPLCVHVPVHASDSGQSLTFLRLLLTNAKHHTAIKVRHPKLFCLENGCSSLFSVKAGHANSRCFRPLKKKEKEKSYIVTNAKLCIHSECSMLAERQEQFKYVCIVRLTGELTRRLCRQDCLISEHIRLANHHLDQDS